MANGTPVANPVWQDIQGMFAPFASQMMWRLNLNSYEDVAANAAIIMLRISTPSMIMPPPPFPPLTEAQVQTFQNWMNNGCPQTASGGSLSATAPQAAAPTPAPAPKAAPRNPGGAFRFR